MGEGGWDGGGGGDEKDGVSSGVGEELEQGLPVAREGVSLQSTERRGSGQDRAEE